MNTKELLEKATNGAITKQEITQVYNSLISTNNDEYDLLLILGYSKVKEYKNIVESYLQAIHDPMLVRLSLQILCRYWGLAHQYLDELKKFIDWEEWDEEEDVRLVALGCVVELYKHAEYPELLKAVYNVFKDENEDSITREAAYETLAIVSGKSPSELPQPINFSFDKDVDNAVLAKVEMLISKQ